MIDRTPCHVTSFYQFFPLPAESLPRIQSELRALMADRQLLGLVLLAEEGINGTVAGRAEAIAALKERVDAIAGKRLRYKDSVCDEAPFHRISVDIRSEIVGLKRPDLRPESDEDHHLSAAEWNAMLAREERPVVIDTRNRYETMMGKFRGAIDPDMKSFSEWGEYLDRADLPKDAPVLIYCTGGIRCEKAILQMREKGFEQVYQLRDGILGYLAECPDGEYEGECFVFDDRVSVGPDLLPTGNYGICPGCGLPAAGERACTVCGEGYFMCEPCQSRWLAVCSKRCRDTARHRG